jgi:NAD(P)H dehydrogenase (quinone)
MIAVTGATGQLGRLVIDALLETVPAGQVIAAVRSPQKAADLAARGVQVREADYERPETLAAAFAGAQKVLLISGSELGRRVAQHAAVIEAAKAAGVGLLAYTSVLHADTTALKLAAEHVATEEIIRGSGLPYALLRHGWYTENHTAALALALEHGAILGSSGQGKVASATREDFARADAAVLLADGQENTVYELSGDVAWTLAELAAEVSAQSGTPVAYTDVPESEYAKVLVGAGLPEPVAEIVADCSTAVGRGELDDVTGQLSRLIGRPTTPLADSVAVALKALRG